MMKKNFKMPVKIQFKQIITSKFLNIIVFNLLWIGLVLGRDSLIHLTLPGLIIYLACLLRIGDLKVHQICLLYTSPSPRDRQKSRMPSSA